LQDCAAGKTFTVRRGGTVAISLTTFGFDRFEIHGLTVSDSSILQTVAGARTVGTLGDYFAVYRAIRSGRVNINALWRYCSNSCTDSMRWEAAVQVS
jgi:hypothetical protein